MAEQRPVTVVTGAASGIGRATALRLAAAGHDVHAVDRDADGLRKLQGVRPHVMDLADPVQRDALLEDVRGAQYLVNAAGVMRLEDIFRIRPEDLRELHAVNVEAAWVLTSGLGREMGSGGAIVNVSSISARWAATTETAAYACTKAALLSLTRSFAHALAGRGVRVNAICPGVIDTPMQTAFLDRLSQVRGVPVPDLVAQRLGHVPLRRAGTPEECAALVCFLLSSDAGYITGQALNQDGGMVMS